MKRFKMGGGLAVWVMGAFLAAGVPSWGQATPGATSRPAATAPARGTGASAGVTPPPAARGRPAPSLEGPSVTFSAILYEIHMPADQMGQLDADTLGGIAAIGDFRKTLAGLGTVRPLYFVDDSVRLAEGYVQIGANIPYLTSAQMTNRGEMVNSVTYTNAGAIFNFTGKAKADGGIELDLRVQTSVLTEGVVTISSKVKAPYFRNAQMAFKGTVKPGTPFVLVSADGATVDTDGKAVVYVARMVMGAVK